MNRLQVHPMLMALIVSGFLLLAGMLSFAGAQEPSSELGYDRNLPHRISNPEQGEWQVLLFSTDVPTAGEEVVFNNATILVPSPELEPPQNFAASDGTLIAQVRMTWTKSESATYYEIYRSVPGTGAWKFLHAREGQYEFTDDSFNADGTVLEYAAKACSDVGCSELSNSDTGFADMPILHNIENADENGDFNISWTLATTASHHEVQESYNGGVWWTEVYQGEATSIDQTDKTAGKWCYRVRGYNGIQEYSPWTPAKCVSVAVDPQAPILYLPASFGSSTLSYPPSPLTFIYPLNGQVLDYDGDYLFKVTELPNVVGYLWGFFQNGVLVWENLANEGYLGDSEYAISSGTKAHDQFSLGPVEVWARAFINGEWTEPAIITTHLE